MNCLITLLAKAALKDIWVTDQKVSGFTQLSKEDPAGLEI